MNLEIYNNDINNINYSTYQDDNMTYYYDNNNNIFLEDYVPYHLRIETYLVPILFAIIFVIGVVGNGTLILIFVRNRNMRNVPNTYIINLAIGDLLLILTCVPFTSTMYTFESWPYGTLICKISEMTKDMSTGVSVFTLTALSAERYCAISNPIRRRISSKPCTVSIAILIWILAAILSTPSLLFSNVSTAILINENVIEYCTPFPEKFGPIYRQTIVLLKFLIYYAIPLAIIGGFYIMMANHLEITTRNMPGELQGQSVQIKARKRVSKMVVAFVIMFIACFLPHHIFMLWFHFHPTAELDYDEFWNFFRILAFCLSFINSCINPIALYLISGVFRKHFHRYLFFCGKKTNYHHGNNNNIIQLDNTTNSIRNSFSCRRLNSVITHQITVSNGDNS